MTEIGHKIATASLWSMGGKLIARLIDFLTLLLLARLLTPEDFGLVAIAVSILVIVETVLELPLTQALLCHETLTDDLLDTAFTLSLIRGGIIAALMLSLAWPIGYLYDDMRLVPLMATLSLAPAMRSLVSPRMVIFMRAFDFKREFCDRSDGQARLADCRGECRGDHTQLLGAGDRFRHWSSLCAIRLLCLRSHAAASWIARVEKFPRHHRWNSVSQILMSFNWQLDRLLLPRFTSLSALGAFSVADSIAGIPHQVFVGR